MINIQQNIQKSYNILVFFNIILFVISIYRLIFTFYREKLLIISDQHVIFENLKEN